MENRVTQRSGRRYALCKGAAVLRYLLTTSHSRCVLCRKHVRFPEKGWDFVLPLPFLSNLGE